MCAESFMRAALAEAELALIEGEMPVGCVIANAEGDIIARAHNERERLNDPTAHAEILAMRRAANTIGDWRLGGCTLYVTLEPCPMCAGAIIMARIARVVYGAPDARGGCAGSIYRLTEDASFNHFAPADGGLLESECKALIDQFFDAGRRSIV